MGYVAGARYTKWIASLELRHKEHNNDSYPLHNNTIDFTQKNETIVHILTWYIEHHPGVGRGIQGMGRGDGASHCNVNSLNLADKIALFRTLRTKFL